MYIYKYNTRFSHLVAFFGAIFGAIFGANI